MPEAVPPVPDELPPEPEELLPGPYSVSLPAEQASAKTKAIDTSRLKPNSRRMSFSCDPKTLLHDSTSPARRCRAVTARLCPPG